MWKHVLPPVVLVIVLWLSISLATSAYLTYSDKLSQRIIEENVTSIEAACDLQVACFRLQEIAFHRDKTALEVETLIAPRFHDLDKSIAALRVSAAQPREYELIQEIELYLKSIISLREQLSTNMNAEDDMAWTHPLNDYSRRISENAFRLRVFNSQLLNQEEARRKTLLSRMMLLRNTTLLIGPLLGVVAGWRLTSRLQRRVSTLAITLRSVASNTVYTVGEYSLRGADDLREVQQLSETVVKQIRQIGTELERAELEIIQSERLAAVGELAAGLAHELRNPLTSIKLLLQHAATSKDQGHITIDNLELILSEILRMEKTLQGLLDFSRPANLSCRIHDVRVPLQRAVNLVSGRAIAARVKISLSVNPKPLLVNGDIEQLHLVFVNLLINSVESMHHGGDVYVKATMTDAGKDILVSVQDDGCGIPPAILADLFQPFVTSKDKGTGLGLALCHRIVSNHQGNISAANRPEGGAIFSVSLPSAVNCEMSVSTCEA